MMIGFFVNDLEREYENYTTTVLAHQAASRGHRVCYITPADFALNPDDTLAVHGRFLPKRKYKDRAESRGKYGMIALAAGGAFVVGGIVWIMTRPSGEHPPPVTGWIDGDGGGLSITGGF